MKARAITLALMLCACDREPGPIMLPPATIAADCPEVVPAADAPPPTRPSAAATATRAYRAVEAAEHHAVTKPGATPASIIGVQNADRRARDALTRLVQQDGNPTPDAIAGAKRALDDLVMALQATPQ
jgi:hypothetical protein